MKIKTLVMMENDNTVVNLSFREGLTTVENSDCVLDAVFCILGQREGMPFLESYRFLARVEIEDTYFLEGQKVRGSRVWDVTVTDTNGAVMEEETYWNMVNGCAEMEDLSSFQRFKQREYPHRLARYQDILSHYTEGEFARLTNGYGTTRSFRSFIAQYIRHFTPKRLRADKELFLKLLPNGNFVVTDQNGERVTCLSNGEKLLYYYFSFLSLADFWARAERVRNLNCIIKPLVVSNFLEFLDDSIDIGDICCAADTVGRQVIMAVPKEKQQHL